MTPTIPDRIDSVIRTYPDEARAGILALRHLIFEEAEDIGPLEETLKWGQPAYLTTAPGTGTTLRLGLHKQAAFAIFAHCQTTVISAYAQAFPDMDKIDGNRAVMFDGPDQIVPGRLRHLIRHALTYHLQKRP